MNNLYKEKHNSFLRLICVPRGLMCSIEELLYKGVL